MINKKELQGFARLKGLTLGNAEKDYLIDIALLSISRNTKNELVFKGGTCLYKFHKLDRFSEDLDFSSVKDIDIDMLVSDIITDFRKFGVKAYQHKKRIPDNSILITIMAEGPLFTGNPQSHASIGIDINLKSPVFLEPETLSFSPIYQDIPAFNSFCMKQEEIFSEKIRALMVRNRSRDLFDLNFLMQRGIYADKGLISKKMEYYNKDFDIARIIRKLKSLKGYWKKELSGFTPNLPDFQEVLNYTANNLKRMYGNKHQDAKKEGKEKKK